MKNSNLLPFLVFLFLFTSTAPISALTITWTGNGPNNLWSNTGNWDLGIVPDALDNVIIPANSGVVYFNYPDRQARRLKVEEDATLIILNWAQLRFEDNLASAVEIFGTLINQGNLLIDNTTGWAIRNRGTIYNRGLIDLDDVGYRGIENKGAMYNRSNGTINIFSSSDAGLATNEGTFLNQGTIRFLDGGAGIGLVVGDDFENATTGSILFEGDNPGNFNVFEGSAENHGLIHFDSGVTNNYPVYLTSGNIHLYNGLTGEIRIEGFAVAGIAMSDLTTLENDGLISVRGNDNTFGIGIQSSGMTFTNGASGRIKIATADYGVSVSAALVFDNYGEIEMTDVNRGILNYGLVENLDGGVITFEEMLTEDIHNEGTFINYYCANIFGEKQILNYVYFVNYGWMTYDSPGANHVYYGLNSYCLNRGIIIDPYDRFGFGFFLDNEMARATFLNSPQAHVPYPDALDIDGTTDLSISNFYLDENLNTSAGTYDLTTNVYTPNNNAIGATTLYAEATAGVDGCTQVLSIRVDGGVQPIAGNTPNQLSYSNVRGVRGNVPLPAPAQLQAFPNPNKGQFTLQLENPLPGSTTLRLLDLTGRTVWTQTESDLFSRSFDFTGQLPAGAYQLQVYQNQLLIGQERILIQ